MDLNDTGIFRLMTEKMAWHNQRQGVLAANIANADTPDYRPNDLLTFDFKKELRAAQGPTLAKTAAGHIDDPGEQKGPFESDAQRRVYETAPDGNGVILEEQMMKIGQNNLDYQTVTNLYRKQVGLLRTALQAPR
jgi:flagellar basal-body rod protein FlgB